MTNIKKYALILATIGIGMGIGIYFMLRPSNMENKITQTFKSETIKLPEPRYKSETSIEKVLLERRSIRDYQNEPLTLTEIAQLLWAAQGITDEDRGFRTAPSAGALYPLEVYVVAGNVSDLPVGVYKYQPQGHQLLKISQGDKRVNLYNAALQQSAITDAAAVIIFSAVYERTTSKYGERGIRYVHLEVGHAAQNVYLQAVALNLGTVTIGAFDDAQVKKIINLADEEQPLYLMPIGRK